MADCTGGVDISELALRHYEAVFRFCARRIGCEHAADAAQETFLTAQKALGRFRGESTHSTWLFGIAHNECRRLARSRRVQPMAIELREDLPGDADTERRSIDRQALQAALQRLSPEHREVVLLHELEGLTYEEAGMILGVPEGTVKSRLHHAFQQLRRHLGGGDW